MLRSKNKEKNEKKIVLIGGNPRAGLGWSRRGDRLAIEEDQREREKKNTAGAGGSKARA